MKSLIDILVSFTKRLLYFRVVSFIIIGGLGYIINMGIYYPLTIIFKNQVTLLGQQFYLPPYLISSFVAIISNYYFNRIATFKDSKERDLGMLKYISTYLVSLPIEIFIIYLLVQFIKIEPVIAATLAILIVFMGRYFVVKTIVWRLEPDEHEKMV